MGGLLLQVFIYLVAAVIAVPIAKRLGLGSVLGYLLAGIAIGPVIGLVGSETKAIQHFAEFGVVMMLFLVGLELQPRMLWQMRNRLIGLGGLQVGVTTIIIAGIAMAIGVYWSVALTIGLVFSLSSTAIVLQTLNEKGLSKTDGGRSSFSVLLFQDIAVIPMLALIPLLVLPELSTNVTDISATVSGSHIETGHTESISLVTGLSGWARALVVLGAVATVLLGGHFLSQPLFRFIAKSRLREIFTASALLLVIGIALLMTLVDLSPALGTFLAGVVLANSEFRHELESDIEPFKGLLLGLFFITVGAGIDFSVLFANPIKIVGITITVMVLKGVVLFALSLLFRLESASRWLFALGLAQVGEFGFVLLNFSQQNNALPPELVTTLSLVVALSMLVTPLLFILHDKLILSSATNSGDKQADHISETGQVIIAGSGRFGQIVNRLLVASGVTTVVLDHEPTIIETLGKFGVKGYYGDASRPELLQAAGIDTAAAIVIAIDDRERAIEMVEHIRRSYPDVKILARAFDVNHLYLLKKAGAEIAVREMFEGSLEIGKATLKALGWHPFRVEKMSQAFRKHDQSGLDKLYELWDENIAVSSNKAYLASAREHSATLKDMMEEDRMQMHDRSDRGWTPPPKDYTEKISN